MITCNDTTNKGIAIVACCIGLQTHRKYPVSGILSVRSDGLFTLHGNGARTGTENWTSTIEDNESGSFSCLGPVWTFLYNIVGPILVPCPVPVPFPFACNVNVPHEPCDLRLASLNKSLVWTNVSWVERFGARLGWRMRRLSPLKMWLTAVQGSLCIETSRVFTDTGQIVIRRLTE